MFHVDRLVKRKLEFYKLQSQLAWKCIKFTFKYRGRWLIWIMTKHKKLSFFGEFILNEKPLQKKAKKPSLHPPPIFFSRLYVLWARGKVIYPKYYKHWHYTVAHTIDWVCSKMLNQGLNHGLFLSFFKTIPCHIHWIVHVLAYLNFKALLALPKMAPSAQTNKSISFIWIFWSTLYVYLRREVWLVLYWLCTSKSWCWCIYFVSSFAISPALLLQGVS